MKNIEKERKFCKIFGKNPKKFHDFFFRAHRFEGRSRKKKRKFLPISRRAYSDVSMDSSASEATEKMSNSWGTFFLFHFVMHREKWKATASDATLDLPISILGLRWLAARHVQQGAPHDRLNYNQHLACVLVFLWKHSKSISDGRGNDVLIAIVVVCAAYCVASM